MTAPDLNPRHGEPEPVGPVEIACRRIVDGRRAARALAEWARSFELSEPEFQVLWCLRDVTDNGCDQTTLAGRLALSTAQVSATVERLHARGWITQQACPGDRRRHLWQLSDGGRVRLVTMLRNAERLSHEPDGREAAA